MKRVQIFLQVAFIALLTAASSLADPLPPAQLKFFEKQVRPLLANNCYTCHSDDAKKLKGGLKLDSREGIREGGEHGSALVPRKPADSLLIQVLTGEHADIKQMPPKEPLTKAQIAVLRKWIAMGAPDPRTGEILVTEIENSIDYEAGRSFWAFQAPTASTPQVKNEDWPKSTIDRHVLAGLEKQGAAPVRDARRRTLIRRAYFDLIGLPPTPVQVESFLNDASPDAFTVVVDELLASPHYGERWGRHWMDVARYAESTGMERNFTYPTAWRYRDYVIQSFNQDKPFDQFIREQVAGDLLPARNADQEAEQLIATSFLAMGPKSLNERNKEIFNMDIVDEQIDVTTRAFMGLTVSCARCHDHKFDPISQMDYYSLAGFFTSTQTHYGTGGGNGNRQVSKLIPIGKDADKQAEIIAVHQRKLKNVQGEIGKLQKVIKSKKPEDEAKLDAWKSKRDEAKARVAEMQQEMKTLRKIDLPKLPQTMGVRDLPTTKDTHFRVRGNVAEKGPLAKRGFLPVISRQPHPEIPANESGRRQFADWIVAAENPLTARVTANRVWKHLFGEGIVRTVDNFGETGERPSNPALLDHLALRLVGSGWSIKQLVRDIMLSRSYQLSSEYDEDLYQIDPDNRLFGRMNHRRLDAEALRDAILFASGSLDLEPAIQSPIARIGNLNIGQNTKMQEQMKAGVTNKRSVYQPVVRNLAPTFMRTFDFAESSIIVGRRDITTVPTQALLMMNSRGIEKYAQALAARVMELATERPERLKQAYALTLCREPCSDERERFFAFMNDVDAQSEEDAWALACQTLFASAEFRYLE